MTTLPIRFGKSIWDSIAKRQRQADQALLEGVLRVTGIGLSTDSDQRRLIALSMLIHALQLPQLGIQDWHVFGEYRDLAAIDVVLAGTIAALNLDQTEVAMDAGWVLARFSNTSYGGDVNTSLLSMLPELPVEPKWECAVERVELPALDLVLALRHPSRAIAISAAQLLSVGAGGHDVSRMLEDVLEWDEDFALQMVALIARDVWGGEACAKLLRRLDRPLSQGCSWLLRELPRLSEGQADKQIKDVLVLALTAADPHVAIAAAETLQSLPDRFLELDPSDVQAAFTFWSARGDYCMDHQRYVHGTCCNRVSLCPRAEMLKLLSRLFALTLHEWLDACNDLHGDVRKAAIQGLVHALTSQPEMISEVISDVDKGKHPSSVLEAILSLPITVLVPAREALIMLFSSESVVLRRVMVRNVATAMWLTKEQANNAVQVALEDNDLTVRNLAVTTLRSLRLTS